MKTHLIFNAVIFAFIISCQDSNESPETIGKLRSLGVKITPHILTSLNSDSDVSYSFYFAKPLNTPDLSVEEFRDSKSLIPLVPMNFSDVEIASETLGTIDLLEVKVTGHLGDLSLLPIKPDIGFALVPFGLKVTSGEEVENVVGKQVIVPDGDEILYTEPEFEIIAPETSAVSASTPLSARSVSQSQEDYRISWYVSSGSVINPKALNSTWKDIAAGDSALIFTARGRKSNAFFIKAIEVTR